MTILGCWGVSPPSPPPPPPCRAPHYRIQFVSSRRLNIKTNSRPAVAYCTSQWSALNILHAESARLIYVRLLKETDKRRWTFTGLFCESGGNRGERLSEAKG